MLHSALTVCVTPVEAKEIVYRAVLHVRVARVFDFLHATNDVLTVPEEMRYDGLRAVLVRRGDLRWRCRALQLCDQVDGWNVDAHPCLDLTGLAASGLATPMVASAELSATLG